MCSRHRRHSPATAPCRAYPSDLTAYRCFRHGDECVDRSTRPESGPGAGEEVTTSPISCHFGCLDTHPLDPQRIRAHLRGTASAPSSPRRWPSERDMLAADGFTEHEALHLLRHDLQVRSRTPAPARGLRRGRRRDMSMRSSTSTGRPSRRSGNSTATGCTRRSTQRPRPVFVSFVTPTSLVTRSPAGLAPRATSSAWPCTPTGRDSDSGSTSLWTRSTGSAAATSPRVGSTPKRRTPPRSRFTRGWASSRLVTS